MPQRKTTKMFKKGSTRIRPAGSDQGKAAPQSGRGVAGRAGPTTRLFQGPAKPKPIECDTWMSEIEKLAAQAAQPVLEKS